jgi:hypothetical protein
LVFRSKVEANFREEKFLRQWRAGLYRFEQEWVVPGRNKTGLGGEKPAGKFIRGCGSRVIQRIVGVGKIVGFFLSCLLPKVCNCC